MPGSYHHHSNVHRRMKRWDRAHKLLIFGLFSLILIVVAVIVYYWTRSTTPQPSPQTPTTSLGAYIGNPKKTISTELFSFESAKNWQLSQENTQAPYKYVFFSQKNGLIEYELTVAFDKSLNNHPVNYAAAVKIDQNRLKLVGISPRCTNVIPKPGVITVPSVYKGAKYICDAQGSKEVYEATVVGDSSYNISLLNSKAKAVTLNLMFEDHSPGHYPDAFIEVIDGFKLK